MDSRENEEFTNVLRSAVREAEKLKYRPTQFKKMLDAHGGFETVNRVLATGKPSDGFTKLWELGRLDLTCEAVIVETKWGRYFDADLLARAEKLLGEMDYPFKRFVGPLAGRSQEAPEMNSPDQEEISPNSSPVSNMRINAFFEEVLNAPVANSRWSWGAIDGRTRRAFLRLWRLDIVELEGIKVILVLSNQETNRPGRNERVRHLELIRAGYRAYGVVCDKDGQESGAIRDFDRTNLLRLGSIIERHGMVYQEIAGVVSVESVANSPDPSKTIGRDLQEIEQEHVAATTRSALVNARLGQGRFRRELLRRWNGACAVSGCSVGAVLRASHCKPWSKSDNSERLDSNNGLILSANVDALFDAGLISFDESGEMLVSGALSDLERRKLGLPARLLQTPNARLSKYLGYHRKHVFQV